MTTDDMICYIVSRDEPPKSGEDKYHFRYPWPKFGYFSSTHNMRWKWFPLPVIKYKATDCDVKYAYEEVRASLK